MLIGVEAGLHGGQRGAAERRADIATGVDMTFSR